MFSSDRTIRNRIFCALSLAAAMFFLGALDVGAADRASRKSESSDRVPPLLLAGGRRLEFVRSFSTEQEVKTKRSFWQKVVDWVAGPPEYHHLSRPYSIVTDSKGRVIVTDPGMPGVHILDFEAQKYIVLEGGNGRAFRSPLGVAVDASDNIYVTDSELGMVFVFEPGGKFRRFIGGDKTRAGFFQRPTGIAIDTAAKRLYVTDTLRHTIYRMDLEGNVLGSFGGRGILKSQFNYPTEIAVSAGGGELVVVDAMNFRVQTFTRDGTFLRTFGTLGDRTGYLLRPKGLALDSEGNVYLADALLETVQVFDREGRLLYYFGRGGRGPSEFQLPAGIFIDARDRIYVADSMNRRIQVFQFRGATRTARGSGQ